MRRIMLRVAYDGTNYCGWQVQPNQVTVEGELNSALTELFCQHIEVIGASRTDTGVHSQCSIAVFDVDTRMDASRVCYALNTRLPEDIRVLTSEEVATDFHPRHTNTRKTYEYHIWNKEMRIPTKRLYTYHVRQPLDVSVMKKAAKYLEGEHDFKSFCSIATTVATTVRTIYEAVVYQDKDEIIIRVTGNGFLYNMVRIITGTLIQVGQKKMQPEQLLTILEACNREKAGPTAPPEGLILVDYAFDDPIPRPQMPEN